jgi:hypothetical protein
LRQARTRNAQPSRRLWIYQRQTSLGRQPMSRPERLRAELTYQWRVSFGKDGSLQVVYLVCTESRHVFPLSDKSLGPTNQPAVDRWAQLPMSPTAHSPGGGTLRELTTNTTATANSDLRRVSALRGIGKRPMPVSHKSQPVNRVACMECNVPVSARHGPAKPRAVKPFS